jgi:hypothetical protein
MKMFCKNCNKKVDVFYKNVPRYIGIGNVDNLVQINEKKCFCLKCKENIYSEKLEEENKQIIKNACAEDYNRKKKDYFRKYYEKNQDYLRSKEKERYEKYKEQCKAKSKKYYEKNREQILAKAREQRRKIKEVGNNGNSYDDKIKEKFDYLRKLIAEIDRLNGGK